MDNTPITVSIDVLDTVGSLHEGVGYILMFIVDGKRYEAAYWVHRTLPPVLVLEKELEDALEAPEDSEAYAELLERVSTLFSKEQLLNPETE